MCSAMVREPQTAVTLRLVALLVIRTAWWLLWIQLATHVILETRAWTLFGVLMVLMGAWVVRLGGVGEHHDEEPALALLLLCLLSIFFFFWLLLSAFFLLCSCFAWLFFFLAPALPASLFFLLLLRFCWWLTRMARESHFGSRSQCLESANREQRRREKNRFSLIFFDFL